MDGVAQLKMGSTVVLGQGIENGVFCVRVCHVCDLGLGLRAPTIML